MNDLSCYISSPRQNTLQHWSDYWVWLWFPAQQVSSSTTSFLPFDHTRMSKLFRSIRLFSRPYLQPSCSAFPISSTKMASGTIRGASPATEFEHQSKRPRLEAEDTQIANPSSIDVQSSFSIVGDCSDSIVSENELVEEQMRLPIEYTRSYDNEINYKNKLVLAPMVRTGSCE